ncbi:hypothetical protein K466DRAFT_96154 [Polyporus arcularius HHB13444]|uniref:Uncharacterized protein n=1 Tax=Polyporus arcularius HHB13444 TaxID=1314778 RepID=A0A5C3PG62_9APHY|nr:hypothetical protein K466DRAFT_96154 [Polyporus arcularius HHB13444]
MLDGCPGTSLLLSLNVLPTGSASGRPLSIPRCPRSCIAWVGVLLADLAVPVKCNDVQDRRVALLDHVASHGRNEIILPLYLHCQSHIRRHTRRASVFCSRCSPAESATVRVWPVR